jgi:hypothetical protein
MNLARDAGTYLYNGPPPWNNGLAGTAVHNTVTVDGRDQMRRAGRFLWVDWAQASGRLYSSPNGSRLDRFAGEHDGYGRFSVKHRRMVQWLAGTGWVIVDDLEGAGEHHLRLHWLVADLPFKVSDSPFQVEFTAGESRVRWTIASSLPGSVAMIRAGEQAWSDAGAPVSNADMQLLGWESPTYGELRPAVSLVYQTHARLPVRFVTVVLTDQRCKLATSNGDFVISTSGPQEELQDEDESEIYRVSLSASVPRV